MPPVPTPMVVGTPLTCAVEGCEMACTGEGLVCMYITCFYFPHAVLLSWREAAIATSRLWKASIQSMIIWFYDSIAVRGQLTTQPRPGTFFSQRGVSERRTTEWELTWASWDLGRALSGPGWTLSGLRWVLSGALEWALSGLGWALSGMRGTSSFMPGKGPLRTGMDPVRHGMDSFRPLNDPLRTVMGPLMRWMDPLRPEMGPPGSEMGPPGSEMGPLKSEMDPLRPGTGLLGPEMDPFSLLKLSGQGWISSGLGWALSGLGWALSDLGRVPSGLERTFSGRGWALLGTGLVLSGLERALSDLGWALSGLGTGKGPLELGISPLTGAALQGVWKVSRTPNRGQVSFPASMLDRRTTDHRSKNDLPWPSNHQEPPVTASVHETFYFPLPILSRPVSEPDKQPETENNSVSILSSPGYAIMPSVNNLVHTSPCHMTLKIVVYALCP